MIVLSKAKMIAVLKFNQQQDGDRSNKHLKNQMITVNNNKLGGYISLTHPTRSAIALYNIYVRLLTCSAFIPWKRSFA